MNEQIIKPIAIRCGFAYDGDDGADDESLRKFAELILKECIDAIDAARPYHTNDHLVNDYMNGVEHGHRFAITMIRKHFGVAE